MSKSAVVFLADGCEPLEVVAPTDVLRRGGVEVVLASIEDDLAIRAAHGVTLVADAPLSALDLTGFAMAVAPGGSVGVDNLGKNARVMAELTRRMEAGESVAARPFSRPACTKLMRPCASTATSSPPQAPAPRCPSASSFCARWPVTRLPTRWPPIC